MKSPPERSLIVAAEGQDTNSRDLASFFRRTYLLYFLYFFLDLERDRIS